MRYLADFGNKLFDKPSHVYYIHICVYIYMYIYICIYIYVCIGHCRNPVKVRTNNLHCKAVSFIIITHLNGWFKPPQPPMAGKKRGAEKPGQLTSEAEMMGGNKGNV